LVVAFGCERRTNLCALGRHLTAPHSVTGPARATRTFQRRLDLAICRLVTQRVRS
jgi:hypothetical protein